MVQLRSDILEDVTRLYFERKRTLIEIDRLGKGKKAYADRGASDTNFNKEIIDKKMKVEELTAYIDALTGGKFSK